jgi:hypothetical protein
MSISVQRLLPYATALAIEASSSEFCSRNPTAKHLGVKLLPNQLISLGGSGLCFKDKNLIKAVTTGFAFPQVFKFLANLKNGYESIVTLLRIQKILACKVDSPEKLALGLRAGIATTAAFANYDPPSIELLSDFENDVIEFKVERYDLSFFLYRLEGNLWKVNSSNPIERPSAILSFNSPLIATQAISGFFDHLAGVGLGHASVSGNIPLLDKIGYISRIVNRKLPSIL